MSATVLPSVPADIITNVVVIFAGSGNRLRYSTIGRHSSTAPELAFGLELLDVTSDDTLLGQNDENSLVDIVSSERRDVRL